MPTKISERLKYILDFVRGKESHAVWTHIYTKETPTHIYEYSLSGKLIRRTPRTVYVKDVCLILNKTRRQVYNYIKTGKLKPFDKFLGKWIFDSPDVMELKHKLRQRKKRKKPR